MSSRPDVSTTEKGLAGFGKEACKGTFNEYPNNKDWHNCSGLSVTNLYGSEIISHAVYMNGKRNGSGEWAAVPHQYCQRNYKDDKYHGWQICKTNGVETREYFVNGVKSDAKAKQIQTASISKECTDLGFSKGTEKHGECILKLREIEALNKSSNSQQTKVLISDVKEKTSTADKIIGLSMMLNALNMGSNLTSQSSSKVDLICHSDCTRKGYGYSFCSSVCSY
tara:strand:- start:755 stop:1426 length:672 start_codon:yes stop_codon:yes gene_type:complete